ncbi:hypothetical protein [Vulcanisaeta distributa]|uniref:hypothetical protein n=1 Tax=Vulcanisaeta distributa TaxID=164451 RepID=UPI001FB1EB5F|nr:hypothetical protein [Vulcanisaeta distributa]
MPMLFTIGTLRMLLSDFGSDAGGDRAKLNAFYAFLVFRGGYATAYRVLRDRLVAGGGESIYTWLRLYRELLGHKPQPS